MKTPKHPLKIVLLILNMTLIKKNEKDVKAPIFKPLFFVL
jgi:hypothetical protein